MENERDFIRSIQSVKLIEYQFSDLDECEAGPGKSLFHEASGEYPRDSGRPVRIDRKKTETQ